MDMEQLHTALELQLTKRIMMYKDSLSAFSNHVHIALEVSRKQESLMITT